MNSSELDQLPKEKGWGFGDFHKYDGFWYLPNHLQGVVAARSNFEARDDDVILAGSPKTGTTWLKALIPTIFSVSAEPAGSEDPLLSSHPNGLMPSLEIQVFRDSSCLSGPAVPDCPQLFRTHAPYQMLAESVRSGGCKVVYVTRDPRDVVVSLYHFINSSDKGEVGLEELFESFCGGVHAFGPFHDHVLGYWNEALRRPRKVLFLRYEEMKRDAAGEVRKLASFLGRPLERDEDVEKVLWRCSLERVKNLEVNATGVDPWVGRPYKSYFRRGIVGDWKNHFTPEMKERLSEITRDKMEGSGLDLEAS